MNKQDDELICSYCGEPFTGKQQIWTEGRDIFYHSKCVNNSENKPYKYKFTKISKAEAVTIQKKFEKWYTS